MNSDGRDDYLIWDDDGGLTGFLNKPTNSEGVPFYVNQGPAKTIADGIKKPPAQSGKNGALSLWYNRGTTADFMAIDGVRFADIDGDGVDDFIWLEPKSGPPTVYLNAGVNDKDSLGWTWQPLQSGKPIATGAAPASQVIFGDIDGDGLDDYLDLDSKTGLLKAYLNLGGDLDGQSFKFNPIGTIASGLGPGRRVRIADIDGDGRDDYIYLKDNGGTTIYRNIYSPSNKGDKYKPLPEADASGIGQSPDEIDFVDINGDGKAVYVWTRKLDGRAKVWYNDYPKKPTWREGGEIAGGVGTSGANVRYAKLQHTGRADYVAIDPQSGAFGAWFSGCRDFDKSEKKHKISIAGAALGEPGTRLEQVWIIKQHPLDGSKVDDFCEFDESQEKDPNDPIHAKYPTAIWKIGKLHGHECFYVGGLYRIGQLVCDGVSGIRCYKDPQAGRGSHCDKPVSYTKLIICEW